MYIVTDPVPAAACSTLYPLIDGATYRIEDDAFTVTTTYGHPLGMLRLHSSGGWSAADDNTGVGEWIQADLGATFFVAAISTQGYSGSAYSRVTQYTISVFVDGGAFTMVTDANGAEVVFDGNLTDDNNVVVRNELPEIVEARVVRLTIVAYNRHASLRWEIEGCPPN